MRLTRSMRAAGTAQAAAPGRPRVRFLAGAGTCTLWGSITGPGRPTGRDHRRVIFSVVYLLARRLLGCLMVVARREVSKDAEFLVLRHQNAVLRRQTGRVRYQPADRLWLAALSRLIPRRRRRDRRGRGKVISKYKTGKHFGITITDASLAVTRNQAQIDEEAALDGFYVLRTPVPASELDAPGVVTAYKNLKYVERDFRHIKADDLDLRPVFHHLEERVKAHVLICMLACFLTWHLRRAWAPLTFTDQDPPAPGDPVAPARRSARAQAKASRQHDEAGRPYRSFRGLLTHLATLTRNQVRDGSSGRSTPCRLRLPAAARLGQGT